MLFRSDNFTKLKTTLLPTLDGALAALVLGLEQKGLLASTAVMVTGEFGRTPKINARAGRDHYVKCWSAALAGCGIKGGQVYGSSDENGVDVKDNPVSEGDFFATIYKALGINPKKENYSGVRPIPLAPFGSNVVEKLF